MKYELKQWTRGWDERTQREEELQDKTRRDSFSGQRPIASFKRGQAALGRFAGRESCDSIPACSLNTNQTEEAFWLKAEFVKLSMLPFIQEVLAEDFMAFV